jgi:hypothetical protein
MARFKNEAEAKKYFEETYNANSAALRLAAWKEANPSAAPAKKAEEKKEEE